ncbi:tryptophan 7-halogenase [Marinimicrobium agarilyticum]|uniref:tryptophan 7-halogenase n=1 Tax=Marinimicrobium agarilyticum TaxID=306546 RepID=UPI0004169F0F|nr:tryptophan 7-halogenase [Marinimicrobium agarilyticum]
MGSEPRALQRLVVVGDGLVAAGAAVTLARLLRPHACQVMWVRPETGRGSQEGGVEVADPALGRWLAMMGYPESELVRACEGLYSLGTEYRTGAGTFFLPYGTHGIRPSPAPFEQEFFKRFQGAEQRAFANHFLATQAARRGRFDFPVDDPRSAKSTLRYGLHLDRAALARCLGEFARSLGVECLHCKTFEVNGDPDSGIRHLSVDEGTEVAGDFFVDATGESALLLGEALGVPFEQSGVAPWRYRLTYQEAAEHPWQPRAQMSREPWGWRRRAGLQGRRVVDCWVRDEAALEQLQQELGACGEAATVEVLGAGRRASGWAHNCLALGHADALPGELALSEWFWASRCLLLWLELLPDATGRPALRAEYNRRRQGLYEILNEVHWMHAANVECDEASLPESLQWRLSVFRTFGRLWRRDDEVLSDEAWVALALGLGWHPKGYDVTLADIGVERLQDKHDTIYRTLVKVAETMPTLTSVLKGSDKGLGNEVK